MVPVDQPSGNDSSRYILHSQQDLALLHVTTLPELFKRQVQNRGHATLFSFRPSPDLPVKTVSYAEAYRRARRISDSLQTIGLKPAADLPVVGIWLERSIELHLAILATTLAGATWLPFDADVPTVRVTACIEDSKAQLLICDAAHYGEALKATRKVSGCLLVTFDELSALPQPPDRAARELSMPHPHDTAYMIYTSGSTGTPKGIEIPHSAAVAFCLSERSILETGVEDVVWQGASAAFDIFIEEV